MKRIMIVTAVLGSLMATGCYFNRGVDETFETDRYTMRMVSWDMDVEGVIEHGHAVISYFEKADTMVQGGTIPEIAALLASFSDSINSTTMYWYDKKKQNFLPGYTYLVVDRDTTQPKDYTPLLQAMMERGLLRADTTYEPLRLLEVYDPARYKADLDSIVSFVVDENGDTNEVIEYNEASVTGIVNQLRDEYRMPVNLAPGVDSTLVTEYYRMVHGNWQADSLWLESRGMRIVPDPQGRKMRVVEFNRCKGKI